MGTFSNFKKKIRANGASGSAPFGILIHYLSKRWRPDWGVKISNRRQSS